MITEQFRVTADYIKSQGFTQSFPRRFFSHVEMTDSCWIWRACITKWGYGSMGANGKEKRTILAHRASWILHFGPIPYGLKVCHDCPDGDNPSCVNPAHLWLGTDIENINDAVYKGRFHFGERTGSARFTEDNVKKMREMRKTGALYSEIMSKFGVSSGHLSGIIHGKKWKYLE